jgi:hypothetical protein
VLLLALTTALPAAELQWRPGRGGTTNTYPTPPVKPRFIMPRAADRTAPQRHDGSAVEQTQFEEVASPRFEAADGVEVRSVVVNRDEPAEITRSAQLPFGDETPLEADIFAPEPPMPDEQPGAQPPSELELDMPSLPEADTLPFEPTQRQPAVQPPLQPEPTFQPTPLDRGLDAGARPVDVPTPSVATMEAERQKAEAACSESLSALRTETIDRVDLTIAVTGTEGADYPFECSIDDGTWHAGRSWEQTVYMWKASALCHKPLYFEDEHLERYGHSWTPCLQPFVSGAHFFATLPVLPYCMGVEPPNECIYALGHYRPGSCAPYMCNPVPFSARGALIQAGAVTGAVLIFP